MKKILSSFLIILLLTALTSCHAFIDITGEEEYETYRQKSHVYAISLQTKHDSTVYFSAEYPGRISEGVVFGPQHVLPENFGADSLPQNRDMKSPTLIKPKTRPDKYREVEQDGIKLVCNIADTIQIPFSEIKQIHIKKIDSGNTAVSVIFITGCGALLIYEFISNFTFDLFD